MTKELDRYLARCRRWALSIVAAVLEARPPSTLCREAGLDRERVHVLGTLAGVWTLEDYEKVADDETMAFQPGFIVLDRSQPA